ncbi:MAG TPA: hypothetical protein VED47_06405 [Burkholderiaceae bacterium]|nr:hypothetical protein [Burkholderiaceae bacterium]
MFRRLILLALLALLGGGSLYLTFVLNWSYSSGERAGWIQKFSRKGWLCKTWEGELIMVSLPGSMPEKFPFTVRDEAVAARVTQAIGQRVNLHYDEHLGLPGTCFGDTDYWVNAVTVVPEPPATHPSAASPQ